MNSGNPLQYFPLLTDAGISCQRQMYVSYQYITLHFSILEIPLNRISCSISLEPDRLNSREAVLPDLTSYGRIAVFSYLNVSTS